MKGYLVDTSVLSLFAPDRPSIPPKLAEWIEGQGEKGTLFTSSIVVLEIRRGISKLRRSGSAARADRLEAWLGAMLSDFDENALDVDVRTALVAGQIEDAAIAQGRNPGLADVLIAASALVHDLTVLMCNVRHFQVLDIPHLDPTKSKLPR